MSPLDGLWWLLAILGLIKIVQPRLHLELQAIFLLLTRRVDIALLLVSILFLPGVLLHETSHYLMAHALGVPTGRFSIIPRAQEDGRLQLGFVETAHTDILRDALIGMAPLIAGIFFIIFVGVWRLELLDLWKNVVRGMTITYYEALTQLYTRPDFWLWFYLVFTVSSTMMPSRSDRRSWLPIALIFVILIGLVLISGVGPRMWLHLAPPLNQIVFALVFVFGISLVIQLILVLPLMFLRKLLVRVTGLNVR